MHIHYIQHEKFEDLGCIRTWLQASTHTISHTHIYENELLPKAEGIDFLIILGGSMGANDDAIFAWMTPEKILIKNCIEQNKKVLGICLGAQLVASVLGAKVYPNAHKEIGWFDINLTENAKKSVIFSNIPENFTTMHWHGDTFDLPQNATLIASSQATQNQAFTYNHEYIVGLQFHPEMTQEAINGMFDETGQLQTDVYVQSNVEIASKYHLCEQNNEYMNKILKNLVRI